jgi:hypothetical protein
MAIPESDRCKERFKPSQWLAGASVTNGIISWVSAAQPSQYLDFTQLAGRITDGK